MLEQAQYWHDPLHFDTYVEKSKFIAEINNEKADKNGCLLYTSPSPRDS